MYLFIRYHKFSCSHLHHHHHLFLDHLQLLHPGPDWGPGAAPWLQVQVSFPAHHDRGQPHSHQTPSETQQKQKSDTTLVTLWIAIYWSLLSISSVRQCVLLSELIKQLEFIWYITVCWWTFHRYDRTIVKPAESFNSLFSKNWVSTL